jgi:flagellar motility protein MotE (MotC chaperone)
MIAKLQHPAFGAALGVIVSVAMGVGLVWPHLTKLVEQAAKPVARAPLPVEFKQKGWDFWTIEVENLAKELKAEREKLKKQSDAVEQRAARIAAEEKELTKTRTEVEGLRRQISERILEISADEAKNLRTLASTYSGLTPKGAVAILKEMDDATVVKILSLMKPDVITPIFEEMSRGGTPESPLAKRAATISEKIRLMKAAKPGA